MHDKLFYTTDSSLYSAYFKVWSGTNKIKKYFFLLFTSLISLKHPSVLVLLLSTQILYQADLYIETENRKLPPGIPINLTVVRVVWQFLASDCSRRSSVSQTVMHFNTYGPSSVGEARIAKCKNWRAYIASYQQQQNTGAILQLKWTSVNYSTISLEDGWVAPAGSLRGEKGI